MPLRYDSGSLGKAKRTPQGGLRVPAGLTRTGVFEYTQPDGRVIREYRPASEVFHADSLATLADAPVTDRHPPELVTPSNFKRWASGHVAGDPRQDGEHLEADLVVQEATLLTAVERRDRTEVSCGYQVEIDPTPGTTPEGERYDQVQRKIRYNHVAIVERGRAGRSAALRLDSEGNETREPAHETTEIKIMKTIRIDGIDYPLSTPAEIDAAIAAHTRHTAKIASEQAEIVKARDVAQGRADAAEGDVKKLREEITKANDPARLDALVASRVELVTAARAVLGAEVKLDGKSEREIMIEAIKKAKPEIKTDGASEDYLRGVFAVLPQAKREDSVEQLRKATGDNSERADEKKLSPADQARFDISEAWKKPLAYAKG